MTLSKQIDHLHKLSIQATAPGPKVVYTKAGTRLSAAMVEDDRSTIDHKAYWCAVRSIDEGRYLTATVNSGLVLGLIVADQPHGQRDPRDFDKLVWTLPIPEFDPAITLHRDLADAAGRAEHVASSVVLPDGHFTAKRRAIRAALRADGVAEEIEVLVAALLA